MLASCFGHNSEAYCQDTHADNLDRRSDSRNGHHRSYVHGDRTFAMSELVQAAHSRIGRHPKFLFNDHANIDPTLAYPRSRLLSDLNGLPDPASASKVFILDEDELGLPGVRLVVRSEEQPYLRGAINALECLIERHGLEKLKSCGVVAQENSTSASGYEQVRTRC